jgi:hypothetical protein
MLNINKIKIAKLILKIILNRKYKNLLVLIKVMKKMQIKVLEIIII